MMKTLLYAAWSLAVCAGYLLLVQLTPAGGLIALVVVVAGAILAAVRGLRLPLMARLAITVVVFTYGYGMCLVGRTMEPGLSSYTAGQALFCFGLFAALPFFCFIRIWPPRVFVPLLLAALPLSFGSAALVAAFEEHQFIRQHRAAGIGPTARWTVSHHWLAYDAEQQKLLGSD